MYKFVVLTTGYVESGAIARVILRCEDPEKNLSKRDFLHKLAKDLLTAWMFTCQYCEISSNKNVCDLCRVPLQIKYLRENYIEFVNDIFRGTADSWPADFLNWNPWFSIEELMQTKPEEVVEINESAAEVLALLLDENDVESEMAKKALACWKTEFTYPNVLFELKRVLAT
jgi:hypothetical protein